MAEQLSPINSLANNTVTTLVALVNAIVNTVATTAVTANGAANGALTIGNGYVSGILGASVLVGGQLRGGNVQSSANLVISSNAYVNSGSLSVGNSSVNSVVNATTVVASVGSFTNATVTLFPQKALSFANTVLSESDLVNVGAGSAVIDSYPLFSARTAEYVIQCVDNAANNYQAQKLLVTHDGFNAYATQYGLLLSNSVVATFAASVNSTSMILTVTTTSANATVRTVRTSLGA